MAGTGRRVPPATLAIGAGAVVAIVAFGWIWVISVVDAERQIRLDDRSLTTTATVLHVEHDDTSDNVTTTVDVRFRPTHHEEQVVHATVTYDGHLERRRGDAVRITYDPEDPETARPAGQDSTEAVAQAAIVTVLVLCIPPAAFFFLRWRRRSSATG